MSAPGPAASDAAGRAGVGDGPAPDLADRYRGEFPILEEKVYLNSNSLGALSRRSMELRREFERDWNALGASAWYGRWLDRLEEVRAGFARTVGARAGDVALMPSISAGLTAVADALDFGERNRVVVTELDFPTLPYQFLARRRRGVEVEMLRSPDGVEVPLDAYREAVDDRTALVATSHVFFSTGAIQDAAGIARIARDAGALLLLDAYQSHGQIPVDVEEIGADFLLSGALKWMLGGPGLAFLWVRPDLARRLEPTSLSWFGVEGQFDFDPRAAEPRDDARRFEMGTPAVGAAFTAAGGLEIVEEAGVGAIRRRNAMLAEDLIGRLDEAGFGLRVAPDPERRSAIVLARHPEPEAAVEHLAGDGIVADARPGVVRFSPHFYNTVEDNARAVESLAAFEEGRS
jgi:selenocysteine lyase/cysteine desulfurase